MQSFIHFIDFIASFISTDPALMLLTFYWGDGQETNKQVN